MIEEEYINDYYNLVDNLTAVCRVDNDWVRGYNPELTIGATYHITHIGVLRSSTKIMLAEFQEREYNASCFDIYENGKALNNAYIDDSRFLAPYLKKKTRWMPEIMEKEAIPSNLEFIEDKYDVKILLAVESGSRAWGFQSEDSDWDVRFIYVHKPEWYFKVESQRDVIEHMYDDVDLVGWELRKALSLLGKNNPSLLEWFHSPIVYFVDKEFERRILEVEKYFFNPARSMYHYNSIYNKHNEKCLQDSGHHMKRFLYYLRGVLACQWIEKNKSIPPVRFKELYEAMVMNENIKNEIEKLIEIKKKGVECDTLSIDANLVEYAQKLADHYNEFVGTFRPKQDKASVEILDSILYDMVMMNA